MNFTHESPLIQLRSRRNRPPGTRQGKQRSLTPSNTRLQNITRRRQHVATRLNNTNSRLHFKRIRIRGPIRDRRGHHTIKQATTRPNTRQRPLIRPSQSTIRTMAIIRRPRDLSASVLSKFTIRHRPFNTRVRTHPNHTRSLSFIMGSTRKGRRHFRIIVAIHATTRSVRPRVCFTIYPWSRATGVWGLCFYDVGFHARVRVTPLKAGVNCRGHVLTLNSYFTRRVTKQLTRTGFHIATGPSNVLFGPLSVTTTLHDCTKRGPMQRSRLKFSNRL